MCPDGVVAVSDRMVDVFFAVNCLLSHVAHTFPIIFSTLTSL